MKIYSFRICWMKNVVWRCLSYINKLVIIFCPFIFRYSSCIRNSDALRLIYLLATLRYVLYVGCSLLCLQSMETHVQRTHKAIFIAFYACDQTNLICRDFSFFRRCPPLFARNIFDLLAFMASIEVFFIYLCRFC